MANLFKAKAIPAPPQAPAPVPVPDPNSEIAREQALKEAAAKAQLAGRASTVLTRNAAGGPAANRGNVDGSYGGVKLGAR